MRRRDKAKSRPLSVRLPLAEADRIEAAAAIRHISVSTYIADALRSHSRPAYPILAAFQQLLQAIHDLRRDPRNGELVVALDFRLEGLRHALRAELRE